VDPVDPDSDPGPEHCSGQFAISLGMAIFFMILQILWRTCKKDVLDQIDIPPLREEIHWLQFR
jgi:hypothetical protein